MSLSWRNRLLVALAPERVAVVRLKRGWRPALDTQALRDCAPSEGVPWAGALAALDGLLEEVAGKGEEVRVVLSNRFVRFVEVPWTTGVVAETDRLALATDCFRATHGDAVGQWRVVLGMPRFGEANVAAAIDGALNDALRDMMAQRRLRLTMLRPHLSAAYDVWRQRLEDGDGGFAVVEPGSVTMLFRRGANWSSVVSRRFRAGESGAAAVVVAQCVGADHLRGGEGAAAIVAAGVGEFDSTAGRCLSGLAGPWPEDPWLSMAWCAA